MKQLRTILILGRVSNLPTVWTNVLLGWFVSAGLWSAELAYLIAGLSLIYVAGMTLNDAFDSQWDKANAPERPIPSGAISVTTAWGIGLFQMVAGTAILFTLTTCHLWLIGVLIAAIFLYNWLHKKWAGSVIFMGVCRACVYAIAASAADLDGGIYGVHKLVWVLAGVSILYIAGLTLAARGERGAENKPTTGGTIGRFLLMTAGLFPILGFNAAAGISARVALFWGGAVLVALWISLVRYCLRMGNIPRAIGFALAGIALYDASVVLFANWQAGLVCIGCFVLTLILQRFIPAT
ncbi:MAG: UbiA family prenyltransferase [Verrucomicrobiota bacterium]